MGESIQVVEFCFHHRWMETRFPFQYGIASMTRLPHLFLRLQLSVNGQRVEGLSSEGLPPKWFTKNPKMRFEEDLPEMLEAIDHAVRGAIELGESASVFQLWHSLYAIQSEWAEANGVPSLLAHLGTSLVERALIDGFCRSKEKAFGDMLRGDELGVILGLIHPELADRRPSEFLLNRSLDHVAIRHTIGLGDPLQSSDVAVEETIDDGLPHSLEASIQRYGLGFFKVKVCGNLDTDIPRLKRIATLLDEQVPGYRITLDGNEQFRDIGSFKEQWQVYLETPELSRMLDSEHLIFVEQPLHRDFALLDTVREELDAWPDAPPMIIDESDAELSSFPRALKLGYRGTSHKNCKGIFKGIANRCLLEWKRQQSPESGPWLMSGEDLANVGPVALLNDLAVMATLGIEHVERNGHHYFAGLSMYPESLQREIRELHPDLYEASKRGFATLKIADGEVRLGSVNAAPFGCGLSDWGELGDPGLPEVSD